MNFDWTTPHIDRSREIYQTNYLSILTKAALPLRYDLSHRTTLYKWEAIAMQVDWDQRYIQSDTPWDSGIPSQHLKSFLAESKVQPGRVLELGCGSGTNAI